MTQVLTYQEVLEAGRLALAEGRLLAANAEVSHEIKYGYRIDSGGIESVCVVGAALNDETLSVIDNLNAHEESVSMLKDRDLIAFNSEYDHYDIRSLQRIHDNWLSAIEQSVKYPTSDNIGKIKENREAFLEWLNSDD